VVAVPIAPNVSGVPGVAVTALENALPAIAFDATTWIEYVVLLVSPVIVHDVVGDVAVQ
jgi:hypothetical protein